MDNPPSPVEIKVQPKVGDHVKCLTTGRLGFVKRLGTIGKNAGEVKGFLVWCGKTDDFFPEDDTIVLWTKEELEDG